MVEVLEELSFKIILGAYIFNVLQSALIEGENHDLFKLH